MKKTNANNKAANKVNNAQNVENAENKTNAKTKNCGRGCGRTGK